MLSGQWAGTVTVYQVGTCTHTSEGVPRERTMQWTVTDDGQVATVETGNAAYEAQIVAQNGIYRLEMEAEEDWCPPTCRFRVVYSMTKVE